MESSFALVLGSVKVSLTVDDRGGFFAMGCERTARFRVTDGQAHRLALASQLRKAINSLRC